MSARGNSIADTKQNGVAAFLYQAQSFLSEMILSEQNCHIQGAGWVMHNLQRSQREAAHIWHEQRLGCYVSITLRACGFFSFLNAICYWHRQSLCSGETFILPSNLFALKSDVNSYYWKILWKSTKLTFIEYIPIQCLHDLQKKYKYLYFSKYFFVNLSWS